MAIRGADGRAVTLAPRLQIALHLSLALNEQNRAVMASAARYEAADAMAAAPAATRPSSTERFTTARHSSRKETVYPAAFVPSAGLPHFIAPESADGPGRLETIAYPGSALQPMAPPGRRLPGQRLDSSIGRGGNSPSRPLRARAGAAAAAAARRAALNPRRPGVTRFGDRPAPVRAGAAVRHAAGNHITHLNLVAAGRRAEGGAAGTALSGPRSRKDLGFARATTWLGPARAANRLSVAGSPAAPRGAPVALYLAEKGSPRDSAADSFGSWAPAALDFRSSAAPPASHREEAPPAPAAAPSAAAALNLEAVSRDVLSRIEKRLRIERERRGRS